MKDYAKSSNEIIDIVSCNNYDGFQQLNFNI
jgi:hypothetical protein